MILLNKQKRHLTQIEKHSEKNVVSLKRVFFFFLGYDWGIFVV